MQGIVVGTGVHVFSLHILILIVISGMALIRTKKEGTKMSASPDFMGLSMVIL